MNNRWGVVSGIYPGGEWLFDYRFAQIPLSIGLSYTFGHRSIQVATGNVNFLTYFQENNGDATVLTQGSEFCLGDPGVFNNLAQSFFSQRGLLSLPGLLKGSQYVFTKSEVSLLVKLGDSPGNGASFNVS